MKIIKYLGVDWGEKRIGLAMADSETKMAIPYETVSDIQQLKGIIDAEEIEKIIIGKPLKFKGEEDKLNKNFLIFLKKLQEIKNIEVILVDERLSSKGADALMGTKKNKAGRDEIAARLILQVYLDKEVKSL
jgi:putative Holliday junction resolvase